MPDANTDGPVPTHIPSEKTSDLSDEGRAWLSDADNKQRRHMLREMVTRFGHEPVQADLITLAFTGERPNPFARGFMRASHLPDTREVVPLWYGIYPGNVTYLVGETGAGKSSELYNVAIHAARNEPLWGIPFGQNLPVETLYLDPENAGNWELGNGGNCSRKVNNIGAGKPEKLRFHDGRDVRLADPVHMASLTERILDEKVRLLILDPIIKLFGTKDENDNAEANREMAALEALARRTNVAIIACHHMGRDSSGSYGRGASARLASADVGIVFRVRGKDTDDNDEYQARMSEEESEHHQRDDVCRLQIVKNRLAGRSSLFLQMAGNDRFDRVDFAAWQSAGRNMPKAPSKAEQARTEITHVLMDGKEHSREEIQTVMQEEGIGRNIADNALRELLAEEKIEVITGPRGAKSYREKRADSSTPRLPYADDQKGEVGPE